MRAKGKGNRREHFIGRKCVERGAVTYVRAGASLGAADLCIIFPRRNLLVQVKSNRWPGTVETETLNRLGDQLHADAYVVATVRVDDGAGSRSATLRARLHVGGARGFHEVSFDELIFVVTKAEVLDERQRNASVRRVAIG